MEDGVRAAKEATGATGADSTVYELLEQHERERSESRVREGTTDTGSHYSRVVPSHTQHSTQHDMTARALLIQVTYGYGTAKTSTITRTGIRIIE